MKVIVKESGFYAGTWHEKGPREVEMNDRVARPFLPPYGAQLGLPGAAAKVTQKSADKPTTEKSAEKKAG